MSFLIDHYRQVAGGVSPSLGGILADGDSITQGFGRYPTWPDFVMADTGTKVRNIAVSGRRLFTMDDEYATASAPFYDVITLNRLVIMGGINDIRAHGADDTDLQTWIQSYCGKAQATGFEVWVCTLMPCSSSWNSTKETYRDDYNTWLRANYATFADGLIDYEAETELSDSTDTTYFADGLHPTHVGLRVMANTVKATLSLTDLVRDNAVLLFPPGTQSISGGTVTPVNWAESLVDDPNLFDTASVQVMTIPSGLNGRYGRFVAGNGGNATNLVTTFTKNGNYFVGSQAWEDSDPAGDVGANPKSPPVAMATGDLFRFQTFAAGSFTFTNNDYNWFGFELLPTTFNGCLVTRTTSLALSGAAITFDTETYDLGGWHSTSSNTERLTVPSGVSRVRVMAGLYQNSSTAVLTARITKNGADFRGQAFATNATAGADGINIATAVVDVTPGDYFEVVGSGGTIPANTNWFSIEEVPADREGALVHLTSSQSVSSGVITEVAFDTEVYDNGAWFDPSDGGAFIVPEGVYRVRVSGNLYGGVSAFKISFRKNGALWTGAPFRATTGGTEAVNAMSAIMPVVPGDVITMTAYDSGGGFTLDSGEENWFCIEAMDALAG